MRFWARRAVRSLVAASDGWSCVPGTTRSTFFLLEYLVDVNDGPFMFNTCVKYFPCSADHQQDWPPCMVAVDPYRYKQ